MKILMFCIFITQPKICRFVSRPLNLHGASFLAMFTLMQRDKLSKAITNKLKTFLAVYKMWKQLQRKLNFFEETFFLGWKPKQI